MSIVATDNSVVANNIYTQCFLVKWNNTFMVTIILVAIMPTKIENTVELTKQCQYTSALFFMHMRRSNIVYRVCLPCDRVCSSCCTSRSHLSVNDLLYFTRADDVSWPCLCTMVDVCLLHNFIIFSSLDEYKMCFKIIFLL